MKLVYLFIISLIFTFDSFPQTDFTPEQIFEMVDHSVVVIISYSKDGIEAQGSGVVINDSGYVVTNHHVVKDASSIVIKHYHNTITDVKYIAQDIAKDLYILKINDNTLTPIKVADNPLLKQGQRIYAIGSPEGYENSISEGIISGFRRDNNDIDLIQTTAPIADGSSGGALVNSKGELIGISVSGLHEGSIYFAIPTSHVITLLSNTTTSQITETFDNNTENLYSVTQTNNQTQEDNRTDVDYYYEAINAYNAEDYEKAITLFSKYLEQNSEDNNAYFKRGYSFSKIKDYESAINDFSKTISNTSTALESYFHRANAFYSLGKYQEALSDYSDAINIISDYAVLYYNRGYTNYKLGNLKQASDDWEKALNLNPEYESELKSKLTKIKNKLSK